MYMIMMTDDFSGPKVLFKTCITTKFVDDDDDDNDDKSISIGKTSSE